MVSMITLSYMTTPTCGYLYEDPLLGQNGLTPCVSDMSAIGF